MTATPEQIAAWLSKAQRDMLVSAKVSPPPSFMPNYHSIEIDCRSHNASDAMALQSAGLVSLPIRIGDRHFTGGYRGEIHPLGLAVAAIIRSEKDGK